MKSFIQLSIEKPTWLLPSNSTLIHTFAETPVKRPDAIDAIQKLRDARQLPHLEKVLPVFLQGALTISPEQKARLWMPATNDANEGALGTMRVKFRAKPNASLESG